ncbi:hypothetical protein Peur_007085 [Populus x canadensis]
MIRSRRRVRGMTFRAACASVSARNLLKPVVAAPRPSAAAQVRTSSRVAINPTVKLATAGEGEAAAARQVVQ